MPVRVTHATSEELKDQPWTLSFGILKSRSKKELLKPEKEQEQEKAPEPPQE
jgi:hypothetical protein